MDILTAAAQPFHELYFTHFQGMADNPIIWIFIWALLFDIITGFTKSLVSHKTTSTKGTDGLIKHSVILFCILTLYPLLDVNGFKNAGDALTWFYTLFYVVSIIENWGQMVAKATASSATQPEASAQPAGSQSAAPAQSAASAQTSAQAQA